jgi:hypothetical protein
MVIINKEDYFFVNNIEDIANTSSNSLIIFEYDEKLISYCKKNSVDFGIIVYSIIQLVMSANSGAKYIINKNKKKIKNYQKIVEHYMYDSQLLLLSSKYNDIKKVAKKRVDGIIFKENS